MDQARVVRITAGQEGLGSGYLLTPRHALTARHVFGDHPKPGQRCTLEPLVDAQGQHVALKLKGKLGWLSPDPALDLAIAVLDRPAPGLQGCIELARLRPGAGESIAVSGYGFPQVAGDNSHPFNGQVNDEPIEQMLRMSVASALPKADEDWSGASGTVLLTQGRAIGVVATVDLKFNGQLSAVPVHRLLQAEGFASWWQQQDQAPLALRVLGSAAGSPVDEIVDQVHWLDREEPHQQAQDHIDASVKRGPAAGVSLVLVPGFACDSHHHLIQRLAETQKIQRLLGREVAPPDLMVPLSWPELSQPSDLALAELLQPLFNTARLEPPADPAGETARAALAQRLEQRALPNAWWTGFNLATAGRGGTPLLDALARFWLQLPSRRPLFLFVCLALDEPPPQPKPALSFLMRRPPADPSVEAVVQGLAADFGERVVILDQLGPIAPGHVGRWVKRLQGHCRASPAQLTVFEAALSQAVGPQGQALGPLIAQLPTVVARALAAPP